MTIITDRLAALDTLSLTKGCHEPPDNGIAQACVMEAVAWIAGEEWSDSPECASPVVGAFLRSWNDQLVDEPRQTLKQYVPRLVGSAGSPEQEDARAWLAMDWLIRTYTPVWLRAAGLNELAIRLEGLPEMRAGMDVPSIRPAIDAVRQDADAAGAAAWDAAWAAAWAAAGDAAGAAAGAAARDAAMAAARDAARDAARAAARAAAWAAAGAAAGAAAAWAAAWDAAGAAAWDAAWDAAWAAAGAAAWDAARAAAWDAARAAARAAAGDAARDAAMAAARDAARDALQPHVDTLQQSAHQLIDRMLAVTETR